jgi:hypothetical protein
MAGAKLRQFSFKRRGVRGYWGRGKKVDAGKMPTLLEDTGGPPVPLFEDVASSFSF